MKNWNRHLVGPVSMIIGSTLVGTLLSKFEASPNSSIPNALIFFSVMVCTILGVASIYRRVEVWVIAYKAIRKSVSNTKEKGAL